MKGHTVGVSIHKTITRRHTYIIATCDWLATSAVRVQTIVMSVVPLVVVCQSCTILYINCLALYRIHYN